MAFQDKTDWRQAESRFLYSVFQEDVLHSVALIDAIAHRLSCDDSGAGAIEIETPTLLLTSSALLAPDYTGPGVSPTKFAIVLQPGTERSFAFTMVGLRDAPHTHKPLVTLSVLTTPGSLNGLVDNLSMFHDSIAHEHKHFLDWDRTGDYGTPSSVGTPEERVAYYNNPGEMVAHVHAACVSHYLESRFNATVYPATVDGLLEASVGELAPPVVDGMNPFFLNALAPENQKWVGQRIRGYINGCLRPMLERIQHSSPVMGMP